jgi:molecular chaperone GrpE
MSTTKEPAEDRVETSQESEVPADEALQQELEDLRRRLEEQERENTDRLLRTMADFDNFRRRARQEKEDARLYANQELLLGILPIIDNFDRALAAAEKAGSSEALLEGVSMILRQMQDFLTKHGVSLIEAVGQPFDPSLHEAVLQAPATEEHPAGTVAEEIQKGYTLNGRLLRPALVKVATAD